MTCNALIPITTSERIVEGASKQRQKQFLQSQFKWRYQGEVVHVLFAPSAVTESCVSRASDSDAPPAAMQDEGVHQNQ